MNLQRRMELVTRVVEYNGDPTICFDELREFGWDCDKELVTLRAKDIRNVLSKFSDGEISGKDIEEWANFIERRDDIDLEESQKDVLNEVIFWLANPAINFPINLELVARIENALDENVI